MSWIATSLAASFDALIINNNLRLKKNDNYLIITKCNFHRIFELRNVFELVLFVF